MTNGPRTTSDPAEIYDRYGRQVYGWAYRVLGRHHDALDVAQDVFVRWVSHAETSVPAHPRAWLRRVAINRAIDLVRARPGRAPAASDACEDVLPGHAEQEELRAAVADALTRLSEQQRAVLVAKVYDGLTFARIAEELGVAVPTVKTHYFRALAAMRDRIAPTWSPPGSGTRGPNHES